MRIGDVVPVAEQERFDRAINDLRIDQWTIGARTHYDISSH